MTLKQTIYWIRNRETLYKDMLREDEQYNEVLIKLGVKESELAKAKQEIKDLESKIEELESKNGTKKNV